MKYDICDPRADTQHYVSIRLYASSSSGMSLILFYSTAGKHRNGFAKYCIAVYIYITYRYDFNDKRNDMLLLMVICDMELCRQDMM